MTQIVEVADLIPVASHDEFFGLLDGIVSLHGQQLLEASLTVNTLYDILWCKTFKDERPLARLVTLALQKGGRFDGTNETMIAQHYGGWYPSKYADKQDGIDPHRVGFLIALVSCPDLDQSVLNRCLNQAVLGGPRNGRQGELIRALLDRGANRTYVPVGDIDYYVTFGRDLIPRLKELSQ